MRAGGLIGVLFLASGLSFALPRADRRDASARADALTSAGRFQEAAEQWETALSPGASDGELKAGLPSLGRCYEALKNYQKALTAYQRAIQFDEKNADRLLDLARVYTRVDLDKEAVPLYERAMALDKGRHDVPLALGQLYLKIGRVEDARRQGALYVQWEPRDPAGQKLMADVEEASGDLASSARRREAIVAQSPSPQAYYDLGRLWARAGEPDMAENAFARAEDLGLRTGALFLNRGVLKWLRGDAVGAEVMWRKALERHPGLGAAHFFLALLEKDRGRLTASAQQARLAAAGAQGDLLKSLLDDLSRGAKR